MSNFFAGSWKTTSAGLLAILGAITHLVFACKSGTVTEMTVTTALTAIVGGIGLIYARDNDKSSEAVGAKQPDPSAK